MITIVHTLSVDDFICLYEDAGWVIAEREIIKKALSNSYAVFSLVRDGETIAMARILGDGAMIYYLKDMVVLKKYQGSGYGKMLIEHIINFIKLESRNKSTVRLEIMSAGGKETFYSKLNFKKSSGYGMVMLI